jgi:hypothetical protein
MIAPLASFATSLIIGYSTTRTEPVTYRKVAEHPVGIATITPKGVAPRITIIVPPTTTPPGVEAAAHEVLVRDVPTRSIRIATVVVSDLSTPAAVGRATTPTTDAAPLLQTTALETFSTTLPVTAAQKAAIVTTAVPTERTVVMERVEGEIAVAALAVLRVAVVDAAVVADAVVGVVDAEGDVADAKEDCSGK